MDGFSFEPDGPEKGIKAAARLLVTRERILVFTGAGISTESGIPDFRGPDGVWTRVDPAEFTYSRFMANPETRRRSWQMRQQSGILDAEPNIAHRALVDLWPKILTVGKAGTGELCTIGETACVSEVRRHTER